MKFEKIMIAKRKEHIAKLLAREKEQKTNCFKCKYHSFDMDDGFGMSGSRMLCYKFRAVLYDGYNDSKSCCEPGFDILTFIKGFRLFIPSDFVHIN